MGNQQAPENADSMDARAGDSAPVFSNQKGVHDRLNTVLQRHLTQPWNHPIPAHTLNAFRAADAWRRSCGQHRPVVLDSGCGNGTSTRNLAACHTEALVVGVDRSAARLQRVAAHEQPRSEGRVLWLRGELAAFWRLCLEHRWPVSYHYLLYPNPYPKRAQLRRRWHGHPVFPQLLELGGQLELRTNWEIYAQEFAQALTLVTDLVGSPKRLSDRDPGLTPFELKYRASGHDLWQVVHKLT